MTFTADNNDNNNDTNSAEEFEIDVDAIYTMAALAREWFVAHEANGSVDDFERGERGVIVRVKEEEGKEGQEEERKRGLFFFTVPRKSPGED